MAAAAMEEVEVVSERQRPAAVGRRYATPRSGYVRASSNAREMRVTRGIATVMSVAVAAPVMTARHRLRVFSVVAVVTAAAPVQLKRQLLHSRLWTWQRRNAASSQRATLVLHRPRRELNGAAVTVAARGGLMAWAHLSPTCLPLCFAGRVSRAPTAGRPSSGRRCPHPKATWRRRRSPSRHSTTLPW